MDPFLEKLLEPVESREETVRRVVGGGTQDSARKFADSLDEMAAAGTLGPSEARFYTELVEKIFSEKGWTRK